MPYTGRHIDTPEPSFIRVHAEAKASRHRTVIVKDQNIRCAFENQKRFRLRRVRMTVRSDICPTQQDIQKSMGIVPRPRMKIVIHAKPRRGRRECCNRIEQRACDELYARRRFGVHCYRAAADTTRPSPRLLSRVTTVPVPGALYMATF